MKLKGKDWNLMRKIEIEIEIGNPRSLKLGIERDLKREREGGNKSAIAVTKMKTKRGERKTRLSKKRERKRVCKVCLGFHLDFFFLSRDIFYIYRV